MFIWNLKFERADKLLHKISRYNDKEALSIMKLIFKEEVRHTEIGKKWFGLISK